MNLANRLCKDTLQASNASVDEVSEHNVKLEKYVEGTTTSSRNKKLKCIDMKRDYVPKFMIIFILSIISSIIIGVIVFYTKYYELIGVTLVCSKACSGGILTLTSFLMFFMSHDLMTWIRRKCNFMNSWLDHYYILHRFCGYLMTIYAIIHSICHLAGSFKILSEEKNINEINDHLAVSAFSHHLTYFQLLFTTIPGITGLIMIICLLTMATTSMRCIRMKCFQVFGYIHMALFPIFLTALIIHGFGFWFRLGTPFAIILVTPGFVMMIVQQLMRIFSGVFYHFEIVDVSISSDCIYAMIYFKKPTNYKLVHGQYVFLNVPEVHLLQWHPFTVASSPSNPYLVLMIKKAGDWTGKLIRLLYERKKQMMRFDEFRLDEHTEYDVFNVLHDLYQEMPIGEMHVRNKLFYPKVKISKACATPNDTSILRRNVVMIGAGSGISPYLPILEEATNHKNEELCCFKFDSAKLLFIAREGEQISWISNYLFNIFNNEYITKNLEFSIYITLQKNVKTLPSFLFWRAFLLIGRKRKRRIIKRDRLNSNSNIEDNGIISNEEVSNNKVNVKFGRPNFESIFKEMKVMNQKLYVYSTTSPALNNHLFEVIQKVKRESGIKIYHTFESSY